MKLEGTNSINVFFLGGEHGGGLGSAPPGIFGDGAAATPAPCFGGPVLKTEEKSDGNFGIACLQERTRTALLESLYQDLHQNNVAIFGQLSLLETKSESGGLFDTFRRAISGKVRSPSLDNNLASTAVKRGALSGFPSPLLPPVGENGSDTTPNSVCSHDNLH